VHTTATASVAFTVFNSSKPAASSKSTGVITLILIVTVSVMVSFRALAALLVD